ncbi:MAG: hypothetical protein ACE5KT_04015 [Methanosarcinales archaeon]
MATGRTVGAALLTEKDRKIIKLAENISKLLKESISDPKNKKIFWENYGKISYTRDAGTGRGAGKLQRDALCTRGRQGKAPFSNRNLRWHPLVVADKEIPYAQPIDSIEVEGNKALIFAINGNKYYPEKVYELDERYVVLPEHWIPHVEILKNWTDSDWTSNSCIIPALESTEWWYALESFFVLGISIVGTLYEVGDIDNLINSTINLLEDQDIDEEIELPTDILERVLRNKENLVLCPLCKTRLNSNVANLPERIRDSVWQPHWRKTKRKEGEDKSIQIMHLKPLVESEIIHTAKNVRYGHRWCNVSMTDHSIDETLDFMEHVVKVHGRCKNKKLNKK